MYECQFLSFDKSNMVISDVNDDVKGIPKLYYLCSFSKNLKLCTKFIKRKIKQIRRLSKFFMIWISSHNMEIIFSLTIRTLIKPSQPGIFF